ncbi:MAG: protein phosphatase 2C domain-containing protein [Bacteroidetes bacterium]|nr:protein phosphatase 2C domain-containing protein [Bacteroidota bacterium]
MEKAAQYLKTLLESKGIIIQDKYTNLLNTLVNTQEIKDSLESITLIQDIMINTWHKNIRVKDFIDSAISIPNATVGKPYSFSFDFSKEPFKGVNILSVTGQNLTINYDKETSTFSSTFTESGQFKVELSFNLEGEPSNESTGIKEVKLLVNPDPKSLWKNLDSDRNDQYWKEDNLSASGIFGSKKFIVGSKRGRSHAHEGIFRDDDFGFNFSEQTGWGIIAVADGAGSAKYSRKGSLIACQKIVEYFLNIPIEEIEKLSHAIIAEIKESSEINQKAISFFCINHHGKAAFHALNAIKEEATIKGAQVKDYSTTLIFAFVKEFENKMFVSSFWVGDGGIGIISKEPNMVSLLGVPDSGEFSGQTRFLTMNEIFADNDYISRIKYKIIDKSAMLILMTDGITDAKFQTDAALEKLDVWNMFLQDLEGLNDDSISVNFDADVKVSEENLMKWMDFWSPGNHDDRTLAILY